MNLYIKTLFYLFVVSSTFAQGLSIIPKPVSAEEIDCRYKLSSSDKIIINKNDESLKSIAQYLAEVFHEKTGKNFSVENGNDNNGIVLNLDSSSNVKAEGYELVVSEKSVQITGKDCQGIFYGVQTLRQLLSEDNGLFVSGCKIIDYPRYGHRGFVLDASRHMQSISYVKKILDAMALLKLNIFHWHLTDDEGWRIESKKYPRLNEIGSYQDSLNSVERNGYYTIAEIKDVLQYAKKNFIKVIPEVEMPGHSRAVMNSYPELLCPTNEGGNTYCAGNPKSYEFIKNVLDEVVDIFDTDVIVVGGDERPKGIWEKCPLCNATMKEKNIVSEDLLQNYFMKDISDYISNKGIQTIAWAENIEGGVPAKQIVENYYPDVSMLSARSGYYTINSNCLYVYFDYPNSAEQKKSKPDWMPVLDLQKVYSFNPTPDSLEDANKKYIIGSECALWTEVVLQKDIEYLLFPRMLAFAEVVWTPQESRDYEAFAERVKVLEPFINSMGFQFYRDNL